MNDQFTSNNIENDDPFINIEDSDYQKLISRLKDINTTIALLAKYNLDTL